jgi:hypothetical protein
VNIGVIVGCELCLDVGNGNEPTDADIESLHQREVEVHIFHRKVVTIDEIVVEKLVTGKAVSGRVTIVYAIHPREPEAPIKVIVLDGVRKTLNINDGLV